MATVRVPVSVLAQLLFTAVLLSGSGSFSSLSRVIICVLVSGFLCQPLFQSTGTQAEAKKYYPTYRKPGQVLQTQPQSDLGYYHQQPYQSPLVTLHNANPNQVGLVQQPQPQPQRQSVYVKKRQQYQQQQQSTTKWAAATTTTGATGQTKFPSYPNVNVYSYNKKATPAPARLRNLAAGGRIHAMNRDDSDGDDDEDHEQDEEDEDNDEDAKNATTPKPPRKPTIGGFTMLLNNFLNPNETESSTEDGKEEGEEEDPPAPLGLSEVELSLIPGVKYKIQHLPDWWGAQVQLSYPITFFFEKLEYAEDSPSFPFGRRLFRSQLFHPNHRVGALDRRGVGSGERDKRSLLSLPPSNTLRGGERAHLLPKLENLLQSTVGIKNGRDCLLKLVCEVHENQVHRSYGFLGELLTLVFSISRSSYSATHLPNYLKAEQMGRTGNCSVYEQRCPHSLFAGADQDQSQCDGSSMRCGSTDYDYDFGMNMDIEDVEEDYEMAMDFNA